MHPVTAIKDCMVWHDSGIVRTESALHESSSRPTGHDDTTLATWQDANHVSHSEFCKAAMTTLDLLSRAESSTNLPCRSEIFVWDWFSKISCRCKGRASQQLPPNFAVLPSCIMYCDWPWLTSMFFCSPSKLFTCMTGAW